jgi:hypothetical protein
MSSAKPTIHPSRSGAGGMASRRRGEPLTPTGWKRGDDQEKRETHPHDAGGKSRPAWPPDSTVTAVFSDCQRYRYQLREIWDPKRPLILWVLMNPSVACLDFSDPTLRKTGRFSRAWEYGGQLVGNVHAYRATDKNRLLEVADPVGPDNERAILSMASEAKEVVLAYGQPPQALRDRGRMVAERLRSHPGLCHLRLAKDGTPMHPLYLPATLRPQLHDLK